MALEKEIQFEFNRAIFLVDPKWPPGFDFLVALRTFHHTFYIKIIEIWVPPFSRKGWDSHALLLMAQKNPL